ncbi:MAG TPA: hypothetical protein VEI80_03080 [Candidatus Acidoferrales bacterium]|nr:hypothetical protein [Candidatus Acidoferrales bacterium]
MRKIFFAALIVVLVALTVAGVTPAFASNPPMTSPPLRATGLKNAVILSSLEQVYPMGQYATDITYYLTHLGYQVTELTNQNVTVNFLLTQLNNYSIVIWRTNTYTWKHIEYWYVGQLDTPALEIQYANDFANGFMNGNAGILGINLNFFTEHFTSGMLNNVQLMVVLATDSDAFAQTLITAGAGTVIFANGQVDLSFGQNDDLMTQVIASLYMGQNVYNAVYGVVSPFIQNANTEDPLDTSYSPPFWYQGDGTLVI